MKHLARLTGAVLLATLAHSARADEPCSARVAVEPQRGWVGQELVYRLWILRREDVSQVRFSDDLTFPSFRVEWLHGQVPDPAITGIGEHRIVAEERRALFPVRSGTLVIPASRIACTTPAGDFEAEVPGTTVEVAALPAPEPGRVVGRVALAARLERDAILLGESVALHVQMHGEANVWDAPPLLTADAIEGVEILAREPVIERESGGRLLLTRTEIYDLVPRATGRIQIPRLHVAWLDPASGAWQRTEATPGVLLVAEAAAVAPAQPAPPRAATARHTIEWDRFAAVALGATVGVWLARFALRRRRHALVPIGVAEPHLDDADAAHARGDRAAEVRALAAALRAAIDSRMPGAHALAAEELVARSDGALRDAAEALADLDRARFAGTAAAPPDPARIRALITAL